MTGSPTMSEAHADKSVLRTRFREALAGISADELKRQGEAMQAIVVSCAEFGAARVVCCYLNMRHEAPTNMIVGWCLESGLKLVVPVYRENSALYDIALLRDADSMEPGRFGIMEPAGPRERFEGKVDLVLVPGLGFDRSGNRLGHGAGYYDRLLSDARFDGSVKIGLGYSFQLVPFLIPADEHDVKMNMVATDGGIWRCA